MAWGALSRQDAADIIKEVKRFLIFVLIAFTAVALGLVAHGRNAATVANVRAAGDRHEAPDFALKDAQGNVTRLSDYRGKVVLLDFWATWCGPCNIEIPWLEDFERTYKNRGFEVLGVSMDDDGWKVVRPFIAEKKINYRIMLGDDKTGDQYGGVEALPTSFLIDRNGRIAKTFVGLSDKEEFQNAIEKLLEAPVQRSAELFSLPLRADAPVRPNGS